MSTVSDELTIEGIKQSFDVLRLSELSKKEKPSAELSNRLLKGIVPTGTKWCECLGDYEYPSKGVQTFECTSTGTMSSYVG